MTTTPDGESSPSSAPQSDRPTWSTPPTSSRHYKLAESVAREIVEDILANSMTDGDVLPSESAMLERYRVGRASLREALRLIEAQGLIKLKPGPGGGPVVARVDAANLGRTAALHLRFCGATYAQLIDAVLLMDPWLTGQAAEIADRAEAGALLASCVDGAHAGPGNREGCAGDGPGFHQAVYELSGNPVLATVAAALFSLFSEHLVPDANLAANHEVLLSDHRAIAGAIINSDADLAKKLSGEHIRTIAASCYEVGGPSLDRRIEWR